MGQKWSAKKTECVENSNPLISKSLLTSNQHHNDGKYFFAICVWTDVAKADGSKRAEREVHGGDVLVSHRGTRLWVVFARFRVDRHRIVGRIGQVVNPANC